MKLNFTFPFILALTGYFIAYLYLKPKEFNAPNMIGLSLYQAIHKSKEYNINLRLVAEEESSDLPPEVILDQNPHPGTLIKERQTIYLVITKARSNPTLERFSNRKIKDIEKWLKNNNLKAKYYQLQNQSLSKDICIGQYPIPGTNKYDKKNIIIYLSNQKNQFILPSFIGKPTNEVLDFLKLYGLKYQTNKQLTKQSKVLEQRPLAYSVYNDENIPEISLKIS